MRLTAKPSVTRLVCLFCAHPMPLQFWNCYVKKRFLSYDYGPRANLRIYGTVLTKPRALNPKP